MPGPLRSKRCQRCRRIKVKCDEKWPTCTPCVRARVQCSGPPVVTTKFINDSHQANIEASSGGEIAIRSSTSTRPAGSLENIRHRDLPGGASVNHFRLHTHEPGKNLTTVADRIAARLVGYMGKDDAPWDMLAYTGYTKHLPVRLSQSVALRDSVALMCSAWINYKRNLPADQVLDLGLYGKALRSLQSSINDRNQQFSCETLASITIIEKLEVLFSVHRAPLGMRHTAGLQQLMLQRGPPKPKDELDVHLMVENHATLIFHWIREGGDNFFFSSSQWKRAIQRVEPMLAKSVSKERMDNYAVGYWYGFWPELVHEFRAISINPDCDSQQEQATALRDRVKDLNTKIKATGEPILERHFRNGLIVEQPDPDTPIGKKFYFESLDSMTFYISYVMIRIVMNRILFHLKALLGEHDMALEVENRQVCIQTWMVLPFVRKLGWVTSALYLTTLYLSYEAAIGDEKEYLLDFLIWVVKYKRKFLVDRQGMEEHMINMAKAMTGRSLFDTTVTTKEEDELREIYVATQDLQIESTE